MNRRSAIRTLVLAGAGSLISRRLPGQPGDKQSDYTIRSEVRLVLLDVAVKDRGGRTVSDLSKDNFSVRENGSIQPITVFANEDIPVTVGLLVDESRSMTPKRADVLAAAQTFIEESNPHDEIFVVNFNESVTLGLPPGTPFSDNITQLRSALYRGIPQGKTALNDAIVTGLEQLELGRRDKKTLIVITDGGDNASRTKRAEMLDTVERSIATMYTIGLYDADDRDRDPPLLKKLAAISGGEAYFPVDPASLPPLCRGIAKEVRSRYTIGYIPPPDGSGSLRHIEVHVSAPGRSGLRVRTRSSYRYDRAEHHDIP